MFYMCVLQALEDLVLVARLVLVLVLLVVLLYWQLRLYLEFVCVVRRNMDMSPYQEAVPVYKVN